MRIKKEDVGKNDGDKEYRSNDDDEGLGWWMNRKKRGIRKFEKIEQNTRKRLSRNVEKEKKMRIKREDAGKNNTVSRVFITSLKMNTEKLELFKDSQFLELLKIKNDSLSSASLIHALCSFYDAKTKLFKLNDEVSFTFCEAEVAAMLGIKCEGKKLTEADPIMKKKAVKFGKKLKALDYTTIKNIVKHMNIDSQMTKLQYQMFVRYYLIDRFLLPSMDGECRISLSNSVLNFEVFESINWAAAALKLIFGAVFKVKVQNQKLFDACSPLFEAMIYNKLPKLKDLYTGKRNKCETSLPVENVFNPKKSVEEWRKELMSQKEVLMCASCSMERSLDNSGRDQELEGIESDSDSQDEEEGTISYSQENEDAEMHPNTDTEVRASLQEDVCHVPPFPSTAEGTSRNNITELDPRASTSSTTASRKSDSATAKFEGFDIRIDSVSTLEKIWQNHGNIVENCVMRNRDIIAVSLEELATMVRILDESSAQSLNDGEVDYLVSTLSDLRYNHFKVDWLIPSVEKAEKFHKSKPLMESLNNLSHLCSQAKDRRAILLEKLTKLEAEENKWKEEMVKISKMIPSYGQVKFDKPIGSGLT